MAWTKCLSDALGFGWPLSKQTCPISSAPPLPECAAKRSIDRFCGLWNASNPWGEKHGPKKRNFDNVRVFGLQSACFTLSTTYPDFMVMST
jgi:hypothetical protein